MSLENASSDMVQKRIVFDLINGKIVSDTCDEKDFCVEVSAPRLQLSQLYKAVFADVVTPTDFILEATPDLTNDKVGYDLYNSIKTIIDNAAREINEKLPAAIEANEKLSRDSNLSEHTLGQTGSVVEVSDIFSH